MTKYKVDCAIETGTWHGHTSLALAAMVDGVVTIESDYINHKIARQNFDQSGRTNIAALWGQSERALFFVLPGLVRKYKQRLYYLDAHWGDNWPLLTEIRAIAEHDDHPIIVIHDFQVPNRPDLGFDSYKGQPLNMAYVLNDLTRLKCDWTSHHNDTAGGHKRGVLFIEPVARANKGEADAPCPSELRHA